MFISLATAMVAVVVIYLLWSLLSQQAHPDPVERDKANIEILTQRLNELKQDLENSAITDAQFQQYRLELEAEALDEMDEAPETQPPARQNSPYMAAAIVLFVPLLSLAIYSHTGNSEFGTEQNANQASDPASQLEDELRQAIAVIEKIVEENPNDVEGRTALAHVYAETGRYEEATAIYDELLRLRPKEPDILVKYAETLARADGNRLTGKPATLLNQALEIAPGHERALWLAGFAEIQANNREQALVHWRRLLEGMESGSEIHQQVQKMLTEMETGEAGTVRQEP